MLLLFCQSLILNAACAAIVPGTWPGAPLPDDPVCSGYKVMAAKAPAAATPTAGEQYYQLIPCEQGHCVKYRTVNGEYYRRSDNNLPVLPLTKDCSCILVEVTGFFKLRRARSHFEKKTEVRIIRAGPKVFNGFEEPHFQRHDQLIARLVADFNANKMVYADCTEAQAKTIHDLDPNLFKALLIQESGGSKQAWEKDPAQVNVPGDWNPYKAHVGLKEPSRRNEGEIGKNLEAALKFLVRKGFGVSAQPARNRPEGYFDNWELALQRYNGRNDKAADGRLYKHVYAAKIIRRADSPHLHEPIEIPKKKLSCHYFELLISRPFDMVRRQLSLAENGGRR